MLSEVSGLHAADRFSIEAKPAIRDVELSPPVMVSRPRYGKLGCGRSPDRATGSTARSPIAGSCDALPRWTETFGPARVCGHETLAQQGARVRGQETSHNSGSVATIEPRQASNFQVTTSAATGKLLPAAECSWLIPHKAHSAPCHPIHKAEKFNARSIRSLIAGRIERTTLRTAFGDAIFGNVGFVAHRNFDLEADLIRNKRHLILSHSLIVASLVFINRECFAQNAGLPGRAEAEEPLSQAKRQREIADRRANLSTPVRLATVAQAEAHVRQLGGQVVRNSVDRNRVHILKFDSKEVIDDDLIVLTKLSELKSLRLLDCRLVDGSGLKFAESCNRLESVFLSGSSLSDSNLVFLSDLPKLNSLYLQNTQLDGSGLQLLAKIAELKSIDVSGALVTDAAVGTLPEFPALEDFSANETAFGDAGCDGLSRTSSLKRIELSNTQVTDVGVQSLATLPRLTVVSVAGTRVSDKSMNSLSACDNLYNLDVSNTEVTDAGLELLLRCPRLNYLNVAGTEISTSCLLKLAAAPELREINARMTGIVAADLSNVAVDIKARILVD